MGQDNLPTIWKGLPVFGHQDRLDQLVSLLPSFELRPFGAGEAANQFLQQVVRLPTPESPSSIPVGVVSRNYNLIQHQAVVSWVRAGLGKADLVENLGECSLCLSTYGERMKLWMGLRQLEFDPGDGHPLRTLVTCQNSVEGSCAMEIKIIQVRTICENGLVSGPGSIIRKTHTPQKMDPEKITNQISTAIINLAAEQRIYSRWLQTKIEPEQIENWADQCVSKKWGERDAARVVSICRHGYDGKVAPVKGSPPSLWSVCFEQIVPGANSPVHNVYHAAQALSWVASHNPHLEVRGERIDAIPAMVDLLQKS